MTRSGRGNQWSPVRGRGRSISGGMGQRNGGSRGSFDPQSCYACGVCSHLAYKCPQNTSISRGNGASTIKEQPRSVQSAAHRSRGNRRSRFSGLNVVYDEDGYEYPIDDEGRIYVPGDEPTVSDETENDQQPNNCRNPVEVRPLLVSHLTQLPRD